MQKRCSMYRLFFFLKSLGWNKYLWNREEARGRGTKLVHYCLEPVDPAAANRRDQNFYLDKMLLLNILYNIYIYILITSIAAIVTPFRSERIRWRSIFFGIFPWYRSFRFIW